VIFHLVLLQSQPVFVFANQAGLDMLETTLVALQDITLDKIFDESGRKALCADFAKLMQEVIFATLTTPMYKLN
jgi:homeobox-leucine zipper protein